MRDIEGVALAQHLHAVAAAVEAGVRDEAEAVAAAGAHGVASRSTGIPTMLPHSVHEPS